MKIYHTETQADYDALMVELEEQGYKWSFRRKLSEFNNWHISEHLTCLRVYGSEVNHASLNYYKEEYPSIPITKYKAKADDEMKFTKENIYKLAERYNVDENYLMDDFKSDIFKLDDTPEKAVVPKCFDEWFKEIEATYSNPDIAKTFALWKLCQQGFGHGYEDVHSEKIPYETDLGKWLFKNKMLAIDAVLNGYTIEPEKVVVPKLVAEWIEQKKEKGTELQTMLRWYRYFYDNVNSYSDEVYFKKAVQWYVNNQYKFIQAYENGYTIEPEQLYYIPLPHLETTDGIQQVLSKRDTYFASRPNDKLQQRFTKEELEQVPEVYKPFVKPIEGGEE